MEFLALSPAEVIPSIFFAKTCHSRFISRFFNIIKRILNILALHFH